MKILLGLLLILPHILVDAQDLGSLQDVKLDPTAGPIDNDLQLNEKPAKASDFNLGDDDDDDEDDDTSLDDAQLNSPPKVSALRPLNAPVKAKSAPRIPQKQLDVNAVRAQVLNDINAFRRLHGAGPLIESSGMNLGAQNWANSLMKTGKATDDPSTKYGQTNCVIRVPQGTAAKECVLSWYRQVQDYDWAKRKIMPNNKRFVQMVWKNTTHAGVGIARGPLGKMFIVVFYDPVGNDNTKLFQNVNAYTDLFTQVAGVTCAVGYTEYKGTCYKYHTEKLSWMNALATCGKEQAVLSNIPDMQMELSMKNWAVPGKGGDAWISLNDRLNESMYMSVEGSAVTYMNWLRGQPNGKNENCVAVKLDSFGTMKDLNCNELHQFICKKPLEGEIAFIVRIKLPGMVWLDDFVQPYSLAYQELGKKFDKSIKDLYKDNKIFKGATIQSISYVRDPAPVVAKPKKVGKRQIAVQVQPVPPVAAATPTSAVVKPTTPKPKGPKKVVVSLILKFGNKGIPGDPTKALQDYLKKHAGKMAQPLNEQVKILSVSIAPPGSFPSTPSYCAPQCATNCMSSCNPSCCYSQPMASPYGASPFSAQQPKFGAPTPNKKKAAAKPPPIPQSPNCVPSATTSCSPTYMVPAPPAITLPPMAAPCVSSPFNKCPPPAMGPAPVSRVPAPNFQARPCNPRLGPCRPVTAFRRILPRFARPNVRALMPSSPCGPPPMSPCIPPMPPMMPPQIPMPMPMAPPVPMAMPFPQMPQANPCMPGPMNNCAPPRAPPKKGAKAKALPKAPLAPPQPVSIQGVTYPSMSIEVHPPRMPMLPMGSPCMPAAPGQPCVPSPPKAGKSKPKSHAPKRPMGNPCMPSALNPCAPPMMPGMAPPMMGAPMMPPMGPMGPPCGPAQGMPCKPPGPKPVIIKLPAIHIKMPKQPPPQPMPQMPMPMPQMPMMPPATCPVACQRLPKCPTYCKRACCLRG